MTTPTDHSKLAKFLVAASDFQTADQLRQAYELCQSQLAAAHRELETAEGLLREITTDPDDPRFNWTQYFDVQKRVQVFLSRRSAASVPDGAEGEQQR